jgi:hypothetical protein
MAEGDAAFAPPNRRTRLSQDVGQTVLARAHPVCCRVGRWLVLVTMLPPSRARRPLRLKPEHGLIADAPWEHVGLLERSLA